MEMVDSEHSDMLSEKQQVTIILHMLMDEQGKLVHGDLLNVNGESSGRFSSWEEVIGVLHEWFVNYENKKSEM
jgi:hypothetical protein